jgi:hypothetical protein
LPTAQVKNLLEPLNDEYALCSEAELAMDAKVIQTLLSIFDSYSPYKITKRRLNDFNVYA